MALERKWPFIVSLGIGIGTVLIAGRSLARIVYRSNFSKRNGLLLTRLKEKLENPIAETTVVTRISEWEEVYSKLSRDCLEIPILGFDCEWVTSTSNGRSQQPVALIQLASHKGVCALVRICCLPTIPETLKAILSNPNILKVGVATWEDASKMKKDLGIHFCGGYDVRHLIRKHPKAESLSTRSGLAGLSEQLLGTALQKHFSVRCSDWEAEYLSDIQVKYAAQDAIASIAVCLKLIAESKNDLNQQSFHTINEFYSTWAKTCVAKDTKFRMSPNNRITSSFNWKEKKIAPLKPNNSRAYATRKTALYDNCILQAPDGQQLCTCDYKKAMWYFAKGRGEVVCENPMTVRLNFEPSGRPSSEYDQYYLLDKVNKCVVCGKDESFLRKNIVPHEYRKHFPEHLKDHKSHDILLLCLECHTICNTHENSIKIDLSIKCDAPIGTERDVKTKLDKRLSGVQRAANALTSNRDTIPASRVAELEESIKQYYEVEFVTAEIMAMARNLQIHVPNADYVPHGLKVVRHFEEQPGGLLAFERLWREHFLKTMQPRHLPALWSVEHHRKPEEKWGNNLKESP